MNLKQKISTGLLLGAVLFSPQINAKVSDLLPRPQELKVHNDHSGFALGRAVSLQDPTKTSYLRDFLLSSGCILQEDAAPRVVVTLVDQIPGSYDYTLYGFDNEAYSLSVRDDRIQIQAVTPVGVIRAAQTLQQMAEGYDTKSPTLSSVDIVDWPAFKLRGLMHDVGRSFVSIEELKKEIDLLARFKVNVFHWHLTEKLAWRFEVKAFPQLTDAANMTRYPGSYYTQEACRELQDYAAARGVTVIPEIDMPGHSDAFRRAMGFDMQTDEGVAALKTILDEVVAVFPQAPYIHIGGDEVRITYPHFLEMMADYVRSKGRKVVVWNRLVAGAPTAAVADMTHMWATSGKKVAGLPNIDSRYHYLNHFDVYADVVGLYKSNIYYEQKGNPDVAGTVIAIWNDTKTQSEEDIIRQNNLYANMLAMAERAWIGGGRQYFETGGTSLPNSGPEYEEFADWERRFLFHKQHSLRDASIPYVRQSNVRWRITEPFPNGGDPNKVFPPETDRSSLLPGSFVYEGKKYAASQATGAGIYLRHIWHPTIPSFYSNPANGQTAYAWTYVYSPKAQEVGAQIEFYTYSRSGNEKGPDAGCWDRKGSRVWVNDVAIPAPVWEQPGASIPQDHGELGLKNENLTARPVVRLQLKAGWNKVFLKLPHANPGGTGRDKWQFTFVLTDTEGRDAVDGLIYSPTMCRDEASEDLSQYLDSLNMFLSRNFSDLPGYYAPSLAASFEKQVHEAYESLSEEKSEEERVAQKENLSAEFERLKEQLAKEEINQPKLSTDTETYWYTLNATRRENRTPVSQGPGQAVVGEVSNGKGGAWKFEKRDDGTYNIINAADKSYLSPLSSQNTPLKTVAQEPGKGWKVSRSNEVGFVIITSGQVQMNQTNGGNGYKIFNWGNGTNLTDDGCKYQLHEMQLPVEPQLSTEKVYYWYQIQAPLRENLYLTGKGEGHALVGERQSQGNSSVWKLRARQDGGFDLVNRHDDLMVSPEASLNTPLVLTSEVPATGWELKPAATDGYYVLVNGSSQVNQTNSSLGYKIYNWGNGTNTTDTGCQFSFTFVAKEESPVTGLEEVEGPDGFADKPLYFTLDGRRVPSDKLTQGIYLMRTGHKVCKILIP